MKLFGRKESPDYDLFRTAEGESAWMPIYQLLSGFFKQGRRPISDQELFEIPLILDMIKKAARKNGLCSGRNIRTSFPFWTQPFTDCHTVAGNFPFS